MVKEREKATMNCQVSFARVKDFLKELINYKETIYYDSG